MRPAGPWVRGLRKDEGRVELAKEERGIPTGLSLRASGSICPHNSGSSSSGGNEITSLILTHFLKLQGRDLNSAIMFWTVFEFYPDLRNGWQRAFQWITEGNFRQREENVQRWEEVNTCDLFGNSRLSGWLEEDLIAEAIGDETGWRLRTASVPNSTAHHLCRWEQDILALAVHSLRRRGLAGFTERFAFYPFSPCSSGCCVSSVHSEINWGNS